MQGKQDYDEFEHRHQFAVWASARAAQRGFTSTAKIRDAIEKSNLKSIAMEAQSWKGGIAEFDKIHIEVCDKLKLSLEKCSYGRAAKMVAIYFKCMIVLMGDHESILGKILHPPIDSILLRNLKKNNRNNWKLIDAIKGKAWTTLEQKEYFELIAALREFQHNEPCFWKLEKYWQV
ncbi:hypothetical protein ACLK29_18300 [Leptospira kirschneri]|uniref:hypothetical protein n=1 Tax=Leptospira kirschneri TaxID=29507 RepID=UPI00398AF6B5